MVLFKFLRVSCHFKRVNSKKFEELISLYHVLGDIKDKNLLSNFTTKIVPEKSRTINSLCNEALKLKFP